jgi:putative transcriptional regulator
MAKRKEEPLKYNRLKIILAEKDIPQKKLAEMVNVERNTISRICNNKNQPSIQLIYKIAIVLDLEINELLNPVSEIRKALPKEKK